MKYSEAKLWKELLRSYQGCETRICKSPRNKKRISHVMLHMMLNMENELIAKVVNGLIQMI